MKGNNIISFDNDYRDFLVNLKEKVRRTQLKASMAANSVLIDFYWELGKEIIRPMEISIQSEAWWATFTKTI